MEYPEKKSPTEPLDLQQKIGDTLAGKRPVERTYPYFSPDYALPFTHIGTQRQLFLDNYMLDHLEGVERVFPSPHRPDQPILEVGDLPWEMHDNPITAGTLCDPADGKFKMWYTQSLSGDPFNTGQVLCYAESTDCLHWTKPLSERCLPYQEHTATNIVARDTAATTVVLNHDQNDPEKKYLLLNCPYGRARELGQTILSEVSASPDGIVWRTLSEDTQWRHQHHMRIIWDEAIQRWIGYGQYSHHWHHGPRTRQIGRQESADFINWSPKEVVISADWDPNLPPHLEFHEMSIRKIGGLYIGITGEAMTDPVWCANTQNGANWRDQFHVRLGLYSSRDGKRWQRVGGPGAWVPNGPPGSSDWGYACFSAGEQLLYRGKIHIPYTACPDKQHWFVKSPGAQRALVPEETYRSQRAEWESLGHALGRWPKRKRTVGALILREDGWAELRPSYELGRAFSKQFVFEGDSLQINAACAAGYVRVEILDPYFRPYLGFAAADCDPACTDDPQQIWRTVTWRGNPDVRSLWNKPCRLVFHLHQASLYAFQFMETRA